MITITDTFWIDERDIEESFIRASGPGGQNVNKVSRAVQLRYPPRPCRRPDTTDSKSAHSIRRA